ncbi:MAG: HEPN domain-containing protein [Thermoflexaceae bacterium]|nr:HEPN domain-containing protein [Thermoflexaceae bacterium]
MRDREMGEAIFRQAFDLWINPEIERRREAERIDKPLELRAAQIVIEPDGSGPAVRLNDEVRGVFVASSTRPIDTGEVVSESDTGESSELCLPEADGNAGHITLLRHGDSWSVVFDFRYNGKRITATLAAAEEFLVTAKAALEDGRLRVAIDTLFSATELCARAMLLPLPDERLLRSKKHGFIASEFNKRGRWSQDVAAFTGLLNRLTELRPRARYTDADPGIGAPEVADLLALAESLYRQAQREAER